MAIQWSLWVWPRQRRPDSLDLERARAAGLSLEAWRARQRSVEARSSSDWADVLDAGGEPEWDRRKRHDRQRQAYGFAFDPMRALRADQLTAGSSGTGQQRRTVVHAVAVDTVLRGRLKRNPGEALCKPDLAPHDWGQAAPDARITCKTCRRLLDPHARN
jgi:hypothetical protein